MERNSPVSPTQTGSPPPCTRRGSARSRYSTGEDRTFVMLEPIGQTPVQKSDKRRFAFRTVADTQGRRTKLLCHDAWDQRGREIAWKSQYPDYVTVLSRKVERGGNVHRPEPPPFGTAPDRRPGGPHTPACARKTRRFFPGSGWVHRPRSMPSSTDTMERYMDSPCPSLRTKATQRKRRRTSSSPWCGRRTGSRGTRRFIPGSIGSA